MTRAARDVASRAHRVLGGLGNYREATASDRWLAPRLAPDEQTVGIYTNEEPLSTLVVVTTAGLHLEGRGSPRFVAYDDIAFVRPPRNKLTARSVAVGLRDGRLVRVPVTGGSGRFRDANEFWRFLDRVTTDRANSSVGTRAATA